MTADSEAYCDQMVAEARMRDLANQLADKEQERHDLQYDSTGQIKKYSNKNKTSTQDVTVGSGTAGVMTTQIQVEVKGTSDLDEYKRKMKANTDETAALKKQLDDTAKSAQKLKLPMVGSEVRPDLATTKKTSTSNEYNGSLVFACVTSCRVSSLFGC